MKTCEIRGVHKILCFCLKMLWFFWFLPVLRFSAGVLPAWCVYTHWHRGKTDKRKESGIFQNLRKKNTIFNENPVAPHSHTPVSVPAPLFCQGTFSRLRNISLHRKQRDLTRYEHHFLVHLLTWILSIINRRWELFLWSCTSTKL